MSGILATLFLSQRFWYRALWRVTSNWGRVWLRMGARILYLAGLVLVIVTIADGMRQDHGRILPGEAHSTIGTFVGLWFASAFAGYLCVKLVHAIEWGWHKLHQPTAAAQAHAINPMHKPPNASAALRDSGADPSS